MKSLWAGVLVLLLATGIGVWLWGRSQILKVDCRLTLTPAKGAARTLEMDPRHPKARWRGDAKAAILDLLPERPADGASLRIVLNLDIEYRQWELAFPPWSRSPGQVHTAAVKTLSFQTLPAAGWVLFQGSQEFPPRSREAAADLVVEILGLNINDHRGELQMTPASPD